MGRFGNLFLFHGFGLFFCLLFVCRPEWHELLEWSQFRASQEPDLQSFLPSSELSEVALQGSNAVTDMAVLYCGPRQPLAAIADQIASNNQQVYVDGEGAASARYHLRLFEEVF
jgi:hypothetical protein